MARKVLVTGGLGFLGSNVVHRCVARGDEVAVLDNCDSRGGGSQWNLNEVSSSVQIVHGDLRNTATCRAAVTGADLVVHCAALTSHTGSQTDPLDYAATNSVGTLVLLEAIRAVNPTLRLIALGTSTQTGPMLRSPIDEQHPEFPADIYSATKTASEKYVLAYAKSRGLRASVVRLANVYGPRAHIRTLSLGFINYFIGLAMEDKEITVFGNGAQTRNVSYVDDCVDAILAVAQAESAIGQVYFATSDQCHSVADIAGAISAHVGGAVRFVPWPAGRELIEVGDAVISNAKIKADIGWRPKTDLADGLRRTRDYYSSRLAQYLGTTTSEYRTA